MRCYESTLDELNSQLWCNYDPVFTFENGNLIGFTKDEMAYEIHPCQAIDDNLRFVELDVKVLEGSGEKKYAFTGLGVPVSSNQYMYLYLDSTGDAFIALGTYDDPWYPQAERSVGGIGKSHRLKIEYTGTEIISSVDGKILGTGIPNSGLGNWFLLTISSYPNSRIKVEMENVRWGVSE